jgi:beta-lactamase class C
VFLQFFRLCLVLFLFFSIEAQVYASDKWFEDYKRYVRYQAKKNNVPGYAFVFYEKGKAPQIVTYGKTHKNGAPVTSETVFRLASVSKTFTSVMMAKYITANDLNWDTPISELLEDEKWQKEPFEPLSVADIVGQSSGFMPNAYDNLIEADYSLARVLNDLSELQLLCKPGQCYTYQNALFGAIADYFYQIDSSYHRQLQDLVFTPLAMNTASVGKAGLMQSKSWARPHMAITRTKFKQTKVESNYYRFAPAAGVNASIQDMTRYLQALLGEFEQVIPSHLVEKITTPRVVTSRERYRRGWKDYLNNAHYGLGWRVYDFNGHIINYHGGWVKGYRADVAFSPETGTGFVMLLNAESNMINSATAEFWHRFFENREAVLQTAAQ